jgi:rubrerythrin
MTQAASQPANDVLVKHLEDMVSDLTIRLAKTENRLAQLEQGKLSQQAGQNKAYSKELARLDSCMEKMRAKMEATPGYNARNLFTCPSCGTTGQLSIPVKCTHCGEEGWWGWWPREKLEE